MADGELDLPRARSRRPALPPWLVPADAAERDALLGVARRVAGVVPRGGLAARRRRRRVGRRAARVPLPRRAPAPRCSTRPRTAAATSTGTRFDAAPAAHARRTRRRAARTAGQCSASTRCSPARCAIPGMPADRLWEMEDAQVNLGPGRGRAVGPRPPARRGVRAHLRQRLARGAGRRAVRLAHDGRVGDLHDDVRRALRRAGRPRTVSPDGHWRMFAITDRRRASRRRPADPARGGRRAGRAGDRRSAVPARRDGQHGVGDRAQRAGAERRGARPGPRARRPDAAGPGRWTARSSTTCCRPASLRAGFRTCRARPATARSTSCRADAGAATARRSCRSGGSSSRIDVKVLKDAEIPREGVVVRRSPR